ncbi:hypothetical protein H6F86_12650 [Phormidium sp. FACHB-592]|uniref:PRC-barrel domain-containing protein n=1 Tax=Stenomitos frigidus AS-A4 TaxID=2933935 RepID=A0ABV0KIX1_9CYAN|nr:hypothetical protein [Phormidium sp. FACHB-592]MBD2074723.1 hypothetical protein [Phormidium sp. FACHB-592]
MNYALPENVLQLATNRRPLERSLLTKIEALKERLDTFTVVDSQSETVGEVRNLVLYKRQLHLVVVQPDVHCHWRFVLLGSSLVQRISLVDRTLVMQITQADMSYLPEQRSMTELSSHRHYASTFASVMAPVRQLPASPTIEQAPMTLLAPIALPTHGKVKEPLLLEHPATPKMVAQVVDEPGERSPNNAANSKQYVTAYPARRDSATHPG